MKKKSASIIISTALILIMGFQISVSAALPSYGEENTGMSSTSYLQKFDDVKETHWAFSYINEMSSRGILKGYPDGAFYPENPVTRAEFAKIMCLASGLTVSTVSSTSYSDVDTDDWFAPYVETGKYYLSGYVSNGQKFYMPDSNALREDIAVALVKLKGYDTTIYDESVLKTMFTDWQSISEGARKYVSVAIEKGLISGFEDNTFRGQDTITRAQASALLWRAYQYGNDNKVFEEEAPVLEKEEIEVPLTLTMKASNSDIYLEYGETTEFTVTVTSSENGEYVPDISGDTEILTSVSPSVSAKGKKTVCKYKTTDISSGVYSLRFEIEDDFEKHVAVVSITVAYPDPLEITMSTSKNLTLESDENAVITVSVKANSEGEYVPKVSGDTKILSSTSPDVSVKGNNTICRYEVDAHDIGTYKLIFTIQDNYKEHSKTVTVTVKEPEPEYTYEMDTLVENIGKIRQMVTTNNGFAYCTAGNFGNDAKLYEYDAISKKSTLILSFADMEYLGTKELSKEEQAKLSTTVYGIGFNQNDNCIYALIDQGYSFQNYILYNVTEACIERVGIVYSYNEGGPSFGKDYFNISSYTSSSLEYKNTINFDTDNNLFINKNLLIGNNIIENYDKIITFNLGNRLCSASRTEFLGYDIRTGKWEKIDYYTGKSGNFTCANNKYVYYFSSDEVHTVDVNGNSEPAFTFNDIDNVDRKIITLSNIKLQEAVAANDGTIYFYDRKYDAIRCIRKK